MPNAAEFKKGEEGGKKEKVLGDAEAKQAQGGVDGFVIWKIKTVGRRLRVLTRLAGAASTCQWYAAGGRTGVP